MISAKINLHSINSRGQELATLEVVMPRYILAEFNTHRIKGKNSASSRAIPLLKMINNVKENTFIPSAWQLEHTGMQGTVYLDKTKKYNLITFTSAMITTLQSLQANSKEYDKLEKHIKESVNLIDSCLSEYKHMEKTLDDWWLLARDKAIEMASIFYVFSVTKQLANRLLEPFMYHKVLVSATEWENFFNLRCPRYTWEYEDGTIVAKSKEEFIKMFIARYPTNGEAELHEMELVDEHLNPNDSIEWYKINEGQADIHMMVLAEAIYDAKKESIPTKLKDGEWHLPFSNEIDLGKVASLSVNKDLSILELIQRISISRCARLSYQTLGDNPVIDYEKDLALYESLTNSGHASPTEHIARAMTDEEHNTYIKQEGTNSQKGWCRNYRGFRQWREIQNL